MQKDIRSIIIAIDGHSSCGKSTVARDLANLLNIAYIDTGAMYRAVTLFALRQNMIINGQIIEQALRQNIENIVIDFRFNPENKVNETYLNGENVEKEIRTLEVSSNVSPVSALGFVRKHLVALQRRMGEKGGVVLDGRDIGTVVFPNADLKIFMTASPEIRAKRRYDEMIDKGLNPKFEEILKNIQERDKIDSTRAESPLRKADDAIVLDNSHMTRREQLEWIINRIKQL